MKPYIVLIGGGGHCKSCIDIIEQKGDFKIAGIVDLPDKLHQKILGYGIIATDDDLPQLVNEYENFLITIGQIKNPERRITIFKKLKEFGAELPVIISPHALVSKHAKIGNGTIIMHHVLIGAGAKIGSNCIINNKALIEHDAIIGDNCHISTGAIINGGGKVGQGTFFGSNSVCKEYIEISEKAVIGCGKTITKNIP